MQKIFGCRGLSTFGKMILRRQVFAEETERSMQVICIPYSINKIFVPQIFCKKRLSM